MKYGLLVISMSLGIIGQLLMKKGVLAAHLSPSLLSVAKTILSPFVFAGIFSYAVSSIVWLFVLQRFPLSVAYPALSVTYVAIVLLSVVILKEPFTISKLIGTLFIMGGVYFIFR